MGDREAVEIGGRTIVRTGGREAVGIGGESTVRRGNGGSRGGGDWREEYCHEGKWGIEERRCEQRYPCGACRFLRRKCTRVCPFAPYFGSHRVKESHFK
jgi:hypothetical protein